jgi:hypothetical protein
LNPFNSSQENVLGLVPVLETVCFTIEENKHSVTLLLFKNETKSAFHRITRLKQFTPNSIFSFIQEKLVVWHFAKTIQTDIASENFIEKTTLLKDIK